LDQCLIEHESIAERFLNTLRKTQKTWQKDKEFATIFQKIEKGKNLKAKEFLRVQSLLWEIGH
jgi:hypothetical protein